MKKIRSFLIIGLFVIFGCSQNTIDYKEYFSDLSTIRVLGTLTKDSLEINRWINYDSLGNIMEDGSYERGLKAGLWKYEIEHKHVFEIDWTIVEKPESGFKVNVPRGFMQIASPDFVYLGTNGDTANQINLCVNKISLLPNQTIASIKDTNISSAFEISKIRKLICQKHLLIDGKEYFYVQTQVYDTDKRKEYMAYNIIGKIDNNEILDILCYFPMSKFYEGSNIFYGIMLHCFYKDKRFLSPFTPYVSIENCK